MFENDKSNDEEIIPEYYVVTDVLDLHGFFPEQIPEIVEEFLQNASHLNLKYLRIIHGKGKSKLKWIVCEALKDNPLVIEFKDAPPEYGGWGATVVKIQ